MDNNPQPAPAGPPDPPGSYDTRMMLIRRYWYLTLKFSTPVISESGRWEASWNGGRVEEDTEPEMLAKLLEVFQDCGDANHQWQTTSEIIDRAGSGNVLLTQRRVCAYCDPKERTIIIHRPDLIFTQDPGP